MTITVQDQAAIRVTLTALQGPAGASTLAAQQAQALAEAARDASAASASNALTSKASAANSASAALQAFLGTLPSFGTRQDVLAAYASDPASVQGKLVMIVADETKNGFSTISYVLANNEPSLSLNFVGNTFTADSLVTFLDFFGLHQVLPPASSTSLGVQGSFAFDTNFLYVCVATDTWRRTALGTF